ncbi:hypothetical protein BJ878DRAFT_231540 [Calycina marina]|uniref:Uncharacterized protein n=1 Tax=Calycina marina TaxID=1763456 RepID=A0A9P7YYC5_9HELO|nr:hypothetical protein BJ878DRAFT_231540 [Calycina marina]
MIEFSWKKVSRRRLTSHLSSNSTPQAEATDKLKPDSKFNQNFSLRITHEIEAFKLKAAINIIVSQHSMLRARLSRSTAGVWQQRIARSEQSSFHFRSHEVESSNDIPLIIGGS